MNKYVPLRILCLIMLFGFLLTDCKKSNVTPPSTTTGKIIYYSISGSYQMEIANKDGSDPLIININASAGFGLNAGPVKMSPDNKTIYFSMRSESGDGTGFDSGIYSCNLDGSNLQTIIAQHVTGQLWVDNVYYIGTQGKILFQKGYPDLTLWTANLDGTDQQQINITLPNNLAPAGGSAIIMSHDATTIFFATLGGAGAGIYSCSINGGNATAVTAPPVTNFDTPCQTFIQSGTEKLLYSTESSIASNVGLNTANLDGTDTQKIPITASGVILAGAGPPSLAQVSPDGQTIFFDAYTSGSADGIYSCNIDGSNVKPVFAVNNTDQNSILLVF